MIRTPCRVSEEGHLVPSHPEAFLRWRGKDVFVSIHTKPAGMRSPEANSYLWGVCYSTIATETGCDLESCHYGLKREAVRQGVLEPEYILLGDKLIEAEPTTRTDAEVFTKYVDWVRHYALHDLRIFIPEAE